MSDLLPEIQQIYKATQDLKGLARVEQILQVDSGFYRKNQPQNLPVYKISFGTERPDAPVLGLIGGVHGIERIGSQVCVSLLNMLSELVLWDKNTQRVLENLRVFFIPTVNPWGILHKRRSNAAGVDLMRNAPVEGEDKLTWLVSGHRYTDKLPWYRGAEGSALQPESKALIDAVNKEIKHSPVAITVDFHSGFGLQDRLWFPYAKTIKPFPGIAYMHSFKDLFEKTCPHHFYQIEPQSRNYTTHGDLWDYMYDQYSASSNQKGVYLPLCLEMGSWMWVKKNPLQLFSYEGPFNPLKSHRQRRTLRRHNTLFEFLMRILSSPQAWAELSAEQKTKHEWRAYETWYKEKK
ncbi:MAG: DUF2817 domain-containing protein [Pseudobdellovibrionaceae bacterium]